MKLLKRLGSVFLIGLISFSAISSIVPLKVEAIGNTYYIATTGSDSNDGSLAHPWLTWQHAIDTAIAGDTVNIEAGSYTEVNPLFGASGTVGNYITFQGVGTVNITISGASYQGVSTNGQNYLQIRGLNIIGGTSTFYGILVTGSDHVTIGNCSVTNTRASGIYGYQSTYMTVDSCTVTNVCTSASEECISLVTCDHFEVKNCIVHDPGATQRIGIDMKVGCTNGSVHGCQVYNLTGYYQGCIYIDAQGIASHDIQIYNNLCYGNPNGAGIAVSDEVGTGSLSTVSIYNNIVYGCWNGYQMAQHGTTTFTNVYFINNTLYNNANTIWRQEIFIQDILPAQMTNCIIRNNIVVGTVLDTVALYDPNGNYTAGKLLIDHNCFYNTAGWDTGDCTFGNNAVQANPLLTSPTTDFTLQIGSPAINTGSATGAPSTDYIGTSRPQGAGYDIGAYEFLTNPALTLSTPSSIAATSATLNGTVTYVGITSPTVTVYWGTLDGGNTAGSWANSSAPTSPSQPQGAVAFSLNIIGLSPATVYYFNAKADNTSSGGGITWAGSASFSTLSATTTTTTISTSIGQNLPIIFGVILIIAMLITAVTTRSITAVIVATIICTLGIFGIVLLENSVISIFGK